MKLSKFWIHHPALLYGLSVLLGTLFVLQSSWAILPLLFLMHRKHVFIVSLLFLLPIALLYQLYTFPPSDTYVSGTFHMKSVCDKGGFVGGWNYRGVLLTRQGRLICQIHSKTWHPADTVYSISGQVHTRNGRFYSMRSAKWQPLKKLSFGLYSSDSKNFAPQIMGFSGEANGQRPFASTKSTGDASKVPEDEEEKPKTQVKKSYCLAEVRYHAKKWVKGYITRHIQHTRAAYFLTGIVTGELEDRVMMQEFSNLGLSHIMAISGFHFALLTLAFHILLRLFLPHKWEAVLLIFLLTLYLLFIGDSPSVQRAWVVAMVFLLGQLFERPTYSLNSLGVALLIATIFNPLSATTLSFQLSFLATAGILILYQPVHQLLKLWIPVIPFNKATKYPLLWQHVYVLATFVREALALTLAVHLALLPLLTAAFHTLSLNSLIYNLFFPFCSSIAIFLFLLSVLSGGILHPLNSWYCESLLRLTDSPPLYFKAFYFENTSPVFLAIYLTILFLVAIYKKENSVT